MKYFKRCLAQRKHCEASPSSPVLKRSWTGKWFPPGMRLSSHPTPQIYNPHIALLQSFAGCPYPPHTHTPHTHTHAHTHTSHTPLTHTSYTHMHAHTPHTHAYTHTMCTHTCIHTHMHVPYTHSLCSHTHTHVHTHSSPDDLLTQWLLHTVGAQPMHLG